MDSPPALARTVLPKIKSFVIIKFVIKLAYFYGHFIINAPIAQLVEQLPFKQMVAGSNPAGRTIRQTGEQADLAQLVEQLSCKQQVVGPNPTVGSNTLNYFKQIIAFPAIFCYLSGDKLRKNCA